ncbi:MAG: CHASE2 domain-containing protein [Alphaproteobacteria bacterium]|nr:CHASE2 domain-containing protein [Alphaproteobacteria bacterium]
MVALSLLMAAFSIRIADPAWIESVRVRTFDMYQRLSPRPAADAPVVIVDIDEKSLDAYGQWPWPRSLVAQLIGEMGKAGVSVVGFDVVFSEYDRLSPGAVADSFDSLDEASRRALAALPSNEAVMAEAMRKLPTVLGQVGLQTALPAGHRTTEIRSPFRAEAGGDPRPFLQRYIGLLPNVPELEAAAAGHGIFSIGAEVDGKVRRVPLLARIDQDIRPTLTLEMLRVAAGTNTLITRRDAAGMQAVQIQLRRELGGRLRPAADLGRPARDDTRAGGGGGFLVPTDANGRIWVHFAEPDAFNTPYNTGRLYISASDVLDGLVAPERLRGKFALVGTSAEGLKDLRDTPVASRMPGVEVHANILESIFAAEGAYAAAVRDKAQSRIAAGQEPAAALRLAQASVDKRGFFLRYPNYINSAELFLTLLAGLILTFLIPRLGPKWTLAGLAIAIAGLIALSWYLYRQHLLLVDATFPVATMVALYAVLAFTNYTREAAEKRQVRSAFGQYLSPALVEQLADHPEQLKLGGETKEMTFLFCDVRNFTAISESYKRDPQQLTTLINRLLTPLSNAILAHDGTIDKYMGDCVMAFWNAPMDVPDHETHACAAALDMLKALDRLNADRQAETEATGIAHTPLRVGVGLNTGECVVGNMGTATRFDYSVLGDAVNLAARLETYSTEYGVAVVLGETTAAKVHNAFALLELDRIAVKGKTEAATIYGLMGDGTLGRSAAFARLRDANAYMLAAYRTRDWDAADRLAAECAALEGAPASLYALHRTRIAAFRETPPPEGWNGVFEWLTK